MTSQPFTAVVYPSVRTQAHEDAVDEARSRGYAAGYADGARQAEQELTARQAELEAEFATLAAQQLSRETAQIETVNAVIAALSARIEPTLADAQQTLATAAVALAEAIIGTELSDSETSARSVVARILAVAESAVIATVRVNPAELPLIKANLSTVVNLIGDPTVNHGDAIATIPDGHIDFRISAAVERVRNELSKGVS